MDYSHPFPYSLSGAHSKPYLWMQSCMLLHFRISWNDSWLAQCEESRENRFIVYDGLFWPDVLLLTRLPARMHASFHLGVSFTWSILSRLPGEMLETAEATLVDVLSWYLNFHRISNGTSRLLLFFASRSSAQNLRKSSYHYARSNFPTLLTISSSRTSSQSSLQTWLCTDDCISYSTELFVLESIPKIWKGVAAETASNLFRQLLVINNNKLANSLSLKRNISHQPILLDNQLRLTSLMSQQHRARKRKKRERERERNGKKKKARSV